MLSVPGQVRPNGAYSARSTGSKRLLGERSRTSFSINRGHSLTLAGYALDYGMDNRRRIKALFRQGSFRGLREGKKCSSVLRPILHLEPKYALYSSDSRRFV